MSCETQCASPLNQIRPAPSCNPRRNQSRMPVAPTIVRPSISARRSSRELGAAFPQPGGAGVPASRLVRSLAPPADSIPLTRSRPESSGECLSAESVSISAFSFSRALLDVSPSASIPLTFISLAMSRPESDLRPPAAGLRCLISALRFQPFRVSDFQSFRICSLLSQFLFFQLMPRQPLSK